ncbi:hypothetical protein SEA_NERGAL_56 [Mycobacterium Phage Nergal]|nr:hypothetical protein SEA_NERGAL_56 [Mycobacterium Phage Nergal]
MTVQDNEKTTESPWWRPVAGVALAIDHTVSPWTGVVHWVTATNESGERHRFLVEGLYWAVADRRIQRAQPPGVGTWERVAAPGEPEVDWSELGKLLDNGQPPADNGEGVDEARR